MKKLIWHADSKESYSHPPYKLYWESGTWSLWNYDRRKACLGRGMTISEAMNLAEQDRQLQSEVKP